MITSISHQVENIRIDKITLKKGNLDLNNTTERKNLLEVFKRCELAEVIQKHEET